MPQDTGAAEPGARRTDSSMSGRKGAVTITSHLRSYLRSSWQRLPGGQGGTENVSDGGATTKRRCGS